jgi:hypothetical protein
MNRRQFLSSTTAILLTTGCSRAQQTSGLGLPSRRVRPGDRQWPDAASWAALREKVGGNLIDVRSLFGACEAAPNGATCLDASKNIRNPYWIGDQPSGTEVSGWLDAWTPATSVYAVKARDAADVASAVNFAREHNLRLVVKGGGPAIWARPMRRIRCSCGRGR